jgi:peptidoglycan/LPS O-acetylase OafA/YrhL
MTGNNNIAAPATRLTSLDAVRGIASFGVVLCHCWAAIPNDARAPLSLPMWSPLINLFTNGDAAVIIFFVLSGYVLALPFFRGTQPSYPRFLFKRFCRIYIPFAVVISIAALLARFTDVGEPITGVGDWLNQQMSRADAPSVLAGHFLMVGTKQDIALNFPMWTLVHEMRISLIFPLLIILCRDTRLALVTAAIMLVASTRILVALGQSAPWTVDTFCVTIIWTIRFMPYFVFGILLSRHSENIRSLIHRVPDRMCIALMMVPIIILAIPHGGYLSLRRDALYDIGMPMLIVLVLKAPSISALLNRAVPQWLGRISYSVYLIHTPVLVVMFHALIGRASLWFIVLSGIATTLATATLTHRFVEVPAMRIGRQFGRTARPTTALEVELAAAVPPEFP